MKKLVQVSSVLISFLISVLPNSAFALTANDLVKWEVTMIEEARTVLKGSVQTTNGTNEFSLVCIPSKQLELLYTRRSKKEIYLYIHFDADNNHQKILNLERRYLTIGDFEIDYTNYSLTADAGIAYLIAGAYKMPENVLNLFENAKSVGFEFRDTRRSLPSFGIKSIPFVKRPSLFKIWRDTCT